MDRTDIDDLTGILKRSHVLAAYRDGPAGRTEIAERADCSRATVYRAESYLDDQNLIEKTSGGYEITGAGEIVLDQIRHFRNRTEGAIQLQPLLTYANTPLLNQNIHLLADAEIIGTDPSSPYKLEHRFRQVINDVQDRMIGMTRGFGSPMLTELTFDRVEAGVPIEWMFSKTALKYFRTEYEDLASVVISRDHVTFYVTDEMPIDLVILDDTLVVPGFDDRSGTLAVVAMTDNPDAIAWGQDVIETHQDPAELIE